MTSEEDIQREIAAHWTALKRKCKVQGKAVKRVRVFIDNTVWDDRMRTYREASWGDLVPLPTLFNQMIAPKFDDTGYVGGHSSQC